MHSVAQFARLWGLAWVTEQTYRLMLQQHSCYFCWHVSSWHAVLLNICHHLGRVASCACAHCQGDSATLNFQHNVCVICCQETSAHPVLSRLNAFSITEMPQNGRRCCSIMGAWVLLPADVPAHRHPFTSVGTSNTATQWWIPYVCRKQLIVLCAVCSMHIQPCTDSLLIPSQLHGASSGAGQALAAGTDSGGLKQVFDGSAAINLMLLFSSV